MESIEYVRALCHCVRDNGVGLTISAQHTQTAHNLKLSHVHTFSMIANDA